ncbi:MAG: hypothetical protein EOO09_15035 [Chitinophagaceae bacterium]|nr:MAG: hypothetical protein EOO09_15035 [Chitinophagaceae bacterium]
MKTPAFLFFLLAISSTAAASGPDPADPRPLSSYSYPIFVLSGKEQFTGTGFFYLSGDTTYLVSNYHVIKGMSPVRQKINFVSDTLYLKYPVTGSSETRLLAIDVSEPVTGETEVFSMVNRIDLLKIPVLLPADAQVSYINDLVDATVFDREPEEVLVYGFPTGSGAVPVFYSRQQKLEGRVNPDGFEEYNSSMRLNFPDASDSARRVISNTSRYYYFLRPFAAQGYSGAPVIGRFVLPDGRSVYRFMGVVFAGQPATRQTWAIKGSVALDYLGGE